MIEQIVDQMIQNKDRRRFGIPPLSPNSNLVKIFKEYKKEFGEVALLFDRNNLPTRAVYVTPTLVLVDQA